jgi:hypothetical protein
MIGALALAIGWRLYAVRDAERAVARAAALIPPTPTFVVDDPRHAITKLLRARYPHEPARDDEASVAGAYLGDPLVELPDPGLRRFLPDTRFFVTRIVSGCFEDDVLVSFRRHEGGEDIRLWVAGTYDGPARRFVSQFLGVPAPTPVDRRALARVLADLVQVIRVGHGPLVPDLLETRAPSSDGALHWLHFDIAADANGRVDHIVVSHEWDHFAYEIDIEVSAP